MGWTTLLHQGVQLPGPYAAHGVPVKLLSPEAVLRGQGQLISLTPDAEEMLTDYVRQGGTTGSRPSFHGSAKASERFWEDWKKLLPESSPIKSLADIDVSALRRMLESTTTARRDARKLPPQAFAYVSFNGGKGNTQHVVPFSVEKPGVFVGRNSEHTGRIRRRILASDVTLNMSKGARVPWPKTWAAVVHNPDANWIASWRCPVTGDLRYARLAESSPSQQMSAQEKFNLARRACPLLPALEGESERLMESSSLRSQQLGACIWMINNLGIRLGHTGNHNALGASTILVRNVSFPGKSSVRFDFVGKDGVRYLRTVSPPPAVVRAIARAAARKRRASKLFDRISDETVNDQISRVVPGASAKVVRTCRACMMFEETLEEVERSYGGAPMSEEQAKLALRVAYARTGLFCNHRANCGEASEKDASVLDPLIDDAMKAIRSRADPRRVNAFVGRIIRTGCIGMYTARTSYIDPRITAAFCKRNRYPFRAAVTNGARIPDKYAWAMRTPGAFRWTDRSTDVTSE